MYCNRLGVTIWNGDSLSKIVTNFLISRKIILKSEADVIIYGYETFCSGIIDLIITLVTGMLLNNLINAIVFFTMFASIRLYSGGYHADSYLKCKLLFVAISATVIASSYFVFPICLMVMIIGSFLVTMFFLCPIENPNKELSDKQKRKYRVIGLLFSIFWSLAAIITYFYISTGHILVIGVSANSGMSNWSFKDCYNVQNRKVAYRASVGTGGHAMAVIGYNDNITCDVNGNGTIEASERGAFKIANSWGTGWKNYGYIWVMYDALNGVSANTTNNWESSEPGTRISAFSRSLYNVNRFNFIEVKNYDVNLAGMLTLDTNYRYNFGVNLFRNNTSSTSYNDSLPFLTSHLYNMSYAPFSGSLLFDYSDYANPVNVLTDGYYYGVDVNNMNLNSSATLNNVSYKVVDNKLLTVKQIADMPTTISNNQNARKSVRVQCIRGDLNYDGSLNSLDLSRLIEYTLDNYDFSNLQNYLADYNEDGVINNDDVSALSLYLLTHSNRSELSKVSALTQKYTKYMIDNNFDKAEIAKMQSINNSIQSKMEIASISDLRGELQ